MKKSNFRFDTWKDDLMAPPGRIEVHGIRINQGLTVKLRVLGSLAPMVGGSDRFLYGYKIGRTQEPHQMYYGITFMAFGVTSGSDYYYVPYGRSPSPKPLVVKLSEISWVFGSRLMKTDFLSLNPVMLS